MSNIICIRCRSDIERHTSLMNACPAEPGRVATSFLRDETATAEAMVAAFERMPRPPQPR